MPNSYLEQQNQLANDLNQQAEQNARDAQRAQRQQQIEAERAQREAEKTQSDQAKEAQRQQNDRIEAETRAKGIPTYVDAHGAINERVPREQWEAEQAAKKKAAEDKLALIKQGIKHTVNPVDGSTIALETPDDVEKRKADRAEMLRRRSIDTEVKALRTEADNPELQKLRMTEAQRTRAAKTLRKAQDDARYALQAKLGTQAKAVTGGNDWVPFNEAPAPEALAATERLKRLQDPAADLTPDDLNELAADPATKPLADHIAGTRDKLTKAEEADKFHAERAAKIWDAEMRRDNPAKWAEMQKQKLLTDPKAVEAGTADFEARKAAHEQAVAPIIARRQQTEQQLAALEQQNLHRVASGIPAGDLVTFTGPDGQPQSWSKELAAKRAALQAQEQEWQTANADHLETLDIEGRQLNEHAALLNEAAQTTNHQSQTTAATQRAQQIDTIRRTPGLSRYADTLAGLDQEKAIREQDIADMYPQDGPERQAALAAIQKDVGAKHAAVSQEMQARQQTVDQVYQGMTGAEIEAGKAGSPNQSEHRDAALIALEQSLGVSRQEAGTMLDDAQKQDWRGAGTATAEGDLVLKGLRAIGAKGQPGSDYIDSEPVRILSTGAISVNPKLLHDPKAYEKAVMAAATTPEAKADAMRAMPDARRELGKQALVVFNEYPSSGFKEWLAKQQGTGNLKPGTDEIDHALAYADHLKADTGPVGRLLDQVVRRSATGIMSLGSQILGLGALATGSETLAQGAGAIDNYVGLSRQMQDFTGANDALFNRAVGQTMEIAPSMLISLGGGVAARGALVAVAKTRPGLALLGVMSKSLRTAKTTEQATAAFGKLAEGVSLTGAAVAGGAQTAGAQFSETYASLRDGGMGHEDAVKASRAPALLSGAVTSLLTLGFGKTGVERLLANPEAAKTLARGRFASILKKAGLSDRAAAVMAAGGKGALEEQPEEILDELFNQVSTELVKGNGASIQSVLADFIDNLPELAIAIGVMGGAGGAVQGYRETQPGTGNPEPGTLAAPNPANLPETVASAESAIDNLAVPDLDPQTLARTQDAARSVLYIAQGTPLTDLPADSLAALDLVEDPKNPGQFINGKIVAGKDGATKLVTYTGGQVADPATGALRPVRVRMQDGQPVISQSTLDKLQSILPAVRAAIPLDENTRKQQLTQPGTGNPAPGTQPPSPQDSVQAPAPAGTPPARSDETPQPDASTVEGGTTNVLPPAAAQPGTGNRELGTPAAKKRANELANALVDLGLPDGPAASVAAAIVAKHGVKGDLYTEQFVSKEFRQAAQDLGLSGAWSSSKAKENPLKAPADLDARLAKFSGNATLPNAESSTDGRATSAATTTRGRTVPDDLSPEDRAATKKAPGPGRLAGTASTQDGGSITSSDGTVLSQPSDKPGNGSVPAGVSSLVGAATGPIDADAYLAARGAAMKATPVADRKNAVKLLGALDKALTRYSSVFTAVRFTKVPGGGLVVQREGGNTFLDVDLAQWTAQHRNLADKAGVAALAEVEEEFIHRAAAAIFTDADMRGFFRSLPDNLRTRVYQGYHVADIANKTLPKELPDKLTDLHATQLGHEFLRMLVQDSVFRGRVSEAVAADPAIGERIIAFLQKLVSQLRKLIDQAPDDIRVTIQEYEMRVTKEVKRLQKTLPNPLTAKETTPPDNLAGGSDNRASVLSSTNPQPQNPNPSFAPVTGATGTAYTDSNDAIDFQWAVVDVNALNISNRDDGSIDPGYPQELQPRDRQSAGSEAQVADIAKNFNLDRLSASNSVGDGAPIIGPDGVVESGNGRMMGARRAYSKGRADGPSSAAQTYREALLKRAAEFGLNAEQVEAVKNPVLVRIRQTEVNRPQFVLSANVSQIAPKRDIEQAKIDAKQIVPDLFDSFVPSEDGEVFTAANAEFIKRFIGAVVPPAERPGVIDASGNLSQSGLRRLRNALFVHAYGSSPEALNALGRLTESIDATDTNIARALIAMAPRFAEQNARIANGALQPLSITEELTAALQTLTDLRNRGEKVSDWLLQDRIPGIGDDPGTVATALVQYLFDNRQRPRQIIEALDRYAKAVDSAGDPRQMSIFGDEKPTKQELWKLAGKSAEKQASLAMGSKAASNREQIDAKLLDRNGKSYRAKYWKNVDSMMAAMPATETLDEYRVNGFVTRSQEGKRTLHVLANTDGSNWRIGATIDVSDQQPSTTVQPSSTFPTITPKDALRTYRTLTKAQEAAPLTPYQSKALETAETALGQTFLFDDAPRILKPAEDLVLEQQTTGKVKPQAEQMSLFSATKAVDPRILTVASKLGKPVAIDPAWGLPKQDAASSSPPTATKTGGIYVQQETRATIAPEIVLDDEGTVGLNPLLEYLEPGQDYSRAALHGAIIKHYGRLAYDARITDSRKGQALFIGGGPAAGKSTFLKEMTAKGQLPPKNQRLVLTADDIKLLIPEMQARMAAGDPKAAASVHIESQEIFNHVVESILTAPFKAQLIWDATLSRPGEIIPLLQRLQSLGYERHLRGLLIDPWEAAVRSAARGLETRRLVPVGGVVFGHKGFQAGFQRYFPHVESHEIRGIMFGDKVYSEGGEELRSIVVASTENAVDSEANQQYSLAEERGQLNDQATSREELLASYSASHPAARNRGDAGNDAGPRRTGAVQGQSPAPAAGSANPLPASGRQGSESAEPQVALAMGRKAAPDAGPDLFSFNAGLGLSTLLTPAQNDAKLQQAANLDLFGNEKPRPTAKRPANPAPAPRPKKPAGTTSTFDSLFDLPGLAGTGPGGERPVGLDNGPGLAGSGGTGGSDAAGGGEAGSPGTDTGAAGSAQDGTDGGLSGLPGDAGNTAPQLQRRPDVGSPERNFEVPADAESLAPTGNKAKILANKAAIVLLKKLEDEKRNATYEEKQVLAAYTGWGAFKEAFNKKNEADIARYWDHRTAENKAQYMPDFLKSWEKNHRDTHKLLAENMTEEEFDSAAASTLNAHYTAAPVIRAMWRMVERLGFKGGRALEPSAGNGHYLGLQPQGDAANRTHWQTVELDELSARLLAKLYPEAAVNEHLGNNEGRSVTGLGFERARIPNGSLDLVISNVPFHESGPHKKGFPTLNLHNFFFAHALDKAKPGGLVAFITSESTMQNNIKQRDFIASKGDLVAAFRLPNNAFKANAGTEVTTDIIIIRKPDGTPFKGKDWRNLVEVGRQVITLKQRDGQLIGPFREEAARKGEIVKGSERGENGSKRIDVNAPIMVNEYFVNHPQNVLGAHTLAGTMYTAGAYAVVAPDGMDVMASLNALIPSLPEDIRGSQSTADTPDIVLAGQGDKPFSHVERDGKIYEVQPDGSMEEAEWSTAPDLIRNWRSWKGVQQAAQELVQMSNVTGADEANLDRMRKRLNLLYDTHVGAHGAISKKFANKHSHLYGDPGYPLTAALGDEVVTLDKKTGKKTYSYKKADILTKRITPPVAEPTKAIDLDDAVAISMAWRGSIQPAFMAMLLKTNVEAINRQLDETDGIFEDPRTSTYETAETYLSGNMRTKLDVAEEAAQDNPKFDKNVSAIRAAMPERKSIGRITPTLGARWIPSEVYNAFIREVLAGSDTVEYIPAANMWTFSGNGLFRTEDHGTERVGPYSLMRHALNMTEPLVYDGSGDDRTVNHADTAAARAALDKMRAAFVTFVKTSEVPVIREAGGPEMPVWQASEEAFNEVNNSYVNPKHKGDYLKFPNLNTGHVRINPFRRSVIARFISLARGMMAHGVGSGKTFSQIMLAYELKRLGKAQKPMIVVQNATLGQFVKSYMQAYPTARVLVPTKKDFEQQNRRRLVAKIATGNWDTVIMPHSQFDLISNKPEAVKAYMDAQIQELYEIQTRTRDESKVRDLQGMLKRLRDRRQKMLDKLAARADQAVFWEDLGVDAIIMDEAHNYKSLPIITRMGRVKGVPTSGDSQRAINFMLKVRNVQAKMGGKNIFLATGTPVKNSMAEAYIMMNYMAPDILADYKIVNFDDFATSFGQMVTAPEMAWSGTPKMESRFVKFQNGPALITMIRSMFDVAFGNEALGLDVPAIDGGEPNMVIVPATPVNEQFNAWVRSVGERWKNASGDEKEEFGAAPIQTMAAGIAAALDPRLISPSLPDHPGSKVNTAVREVLAIYKAGHGRKTTQAIFSDLRNPFSMDYLVPFTGHPFPDHGSDGEFDLYLDIKAKLIAGGMKESEILLMESGFSDKKKTELFDKVNRGEFRVVIGSTELLGVGVNIQERLKAVHHLMPPRDFTPAMQEQRNGRIIRQGNMHAAKVEGQPAWNEPVIINNFGTEKSMDSAIYGALARKQRAVTQLLMGEETADVFDDPTDPSAVNLAEMAARTLGDLDFIRKIELEKEVKDLRLLRDAFANEAGGRKSRLLRTKQWIRNLPGFVAEVKQAREAQRKRWVRTAPRPEGVRETTDISDKAVYEFGDQTIDTAAPKNNAITLPLDIWLQTMSKAMDRRGQKRFPTSFTVNGNPVFIEVHTTNPGQDTPGYIFDTEGQTSGGTPFRGAASLLMSLHIPDEHFEMKLRSYERELKDSAIQADKLREAIDKAPAEFPDSQKLRELEDEMAEVDARLAAKAAPPAPAPSTSGGGSGSGTTVNGVELPEMQAPDPDLMTDDVVDAIDNAVIMANRLTLPDTLDRKLYVKVNRALESAGGRWSKRAKAHMFRGDPGPLFGFPPQPGMEPVPEERDLSGSRPTLQGPPREAPLAMGTKAADTHASPSSYENAPLDPFTGSRSLITGSHTTREQGQAIGRLHAQRLRNGLREGRESGRTGPALADSRSRAFSVEGRAAAPPAAASPPQTALAGASALPPVPVLTDEQFDRLTALHEIGEGSEGTVFADKRRGVIYKVLGGYQKSSFLGIYPDVYYTADGKLDYTFQAAVRPRQLAARVAVQTLIGGTPTEIAGIGPNGQIILKQPLSPDADLMGIAQADEDSMALGGADLAQRVAAAIGGHDAGLVQVPKGLLLDPDAPRPYIAVVEGRPWLIADVRNENFVGDNHGNARLNDPVVAHIPMEMIPRVPGLASVITQAGQEAARLGDRSARLFKSSVAYHEPVRGTDEAPPASPNMDDFMPPREDRKATPGFLKDGWTLWHEALAEWKQEFAAWAERQPSLAAFISKPKLDKEGLPRYQSAHVVTRIPRAAGGWRSTVFSRYLENKPNTSYGDFADGFWVPTSHSEFKEKVEAFEDAQGAAGAEASYTTQPLFASTKSPTTSPQSPSPLAKLGWNHLDRAVSAKVAAHTRWLRDSAGETVARWQGNPNVAPFMQLGKLVKRELFPDSVLPREIAAKKREMEIKTALGAQKGMDLVRALSGSPKFSDLVYPPEFSQNPMHRRNLYLAMAGEAPMNSLPQTLQDLGAKLREMLVEMGREAVKQGRMSTDTFANLQAGYMPHFYKEDVQREKSLFHRFRLGVRDILAQRTTAWHITDLQNKDQTGEPRLVSWQGNQWRFRNQEHRDAFFEDFLLQQALEQIHRRGGKKNRTLTITDLRAPAALDPETRGRLAEINRGLRQRYKKERPLSVDEQEKAGLIMDPVYAIARYTAQMVHDNSTAEFFNFVAGNTEWTSDNATPGFTEIPDNPRFGRLAGKYVNDDVARQILEMVEAPNVALKIYDTMLGWWKAGKTVYNIGTHVRNVLSNLFFSHLAGNSLHNIGNVRYYKQSIASLRNGGASLQEAYEMGVLGADFVSAELRQTLRQLLPDPATINEADDKAQGIIMGIGKAIGRIVPQWAANPLHKANNHVTALYQAEDEVFKLAAYLKAKDMGLTPEQARDHVRQWFPYFDLGTSSSLKTLGRTAMPFLSFYRESIRIFGEAMKHRPVALAGGMAIPSLITLFSAMALGLDDDDLEEIKKDMRGKGGKLLGPTPLGGIPLFSMLLPTRSSTGEVQQFDLSAIYPFTDLLGTRVEGTEGQGWWQQMWRAFISGGPLQSLAYANALNMDAFSMREIVEPGMGTGEALQKRVENAFQTLMPPLMPGIPGVTGVGQNIETLSNAGAFPWQEAQRGTDKTLRQRSPAQAVARAVFGLDVRPGSPDIYRQADDWRKARGYEVIPGMDYGSTTPASRGRKLLFKHLAQDNPNLEAVKNITQRLKEMGHPVETPKDIQQLLYFKDPAHLIGGNKKLGISAEDARQQFRASLNGESRRLYDDAVATYQKIKARAPALIMQAQMAQ